MGDFLRIYIRPLATVSFFAAAITGLMVYFGLHNHALREGHAWFSLTFAVIALLRIVIDPSGFKLMLGKLNALILCGVFGVIALLMIGSAMNTPDADYYGPVRHSHRQPPPQPPIQLERRLGEAPLRKLAPAFGMTVEQAQTRLRDHGITVTGPGQSLNAIAKANRKSAPSLYQLLLKP